MSLSREEIIERAALELAEARSAASIGPMAEAALARVGTAGAGGEEPEVLVVDVTRVGNDGCTDVAGLARGRRTVGVTLAFDACTAERERGVRLDRLIGPFGVIDVQPEGLVVVEVALGVSARVLQEQSTAPLLAGPSLGPVTGLSR